MFGKSGLIFYIIRKWALSQQHWLILHGFFMFKKVLHYGLFVACSFSIARLAHLSLECVNVSFKKTKNVLVQGAEVTLKPLLKKSSPFPRQTFLTHSHTRRSTGEINSVNDGSVSSLVPVRPLN